MATTMNVPRAEPPTPPAWEISAVESRGSKIYVQARIAGNRVGRAGCQWVDYNLKFVVKAGVATCEGGTFRISNVLDGEAFTTPLPTDFLKACSAAALAKRQRK